MVTDHRHGGYDMDDNEIGIFLSISSLAAVLYQVDFCNSPWTMVYNVARWNVIILPKLNLIYPKVAVKVIICGYTQYHPVGIRVFTTWQTIRIQEQF